MVLFHFPGGGAYTLGRHNHGDCWYLFTIDNITDGLQIPDQTLEVSFFILRRSLTKNVLMNELSTTSL